MVALKQPGLRRYLRLQQALAAAQSAELEPGDPVYIPYFWWHQVQSLERFNVPVNYGWTAAGVRFGRPHDRLPHGVLTLWHLPARQRTAWRSVFDHSVFQSGPGPVAHLPPENRGALGPMAPAFAAHIKAALLMRPQRS